MNKASQIADHIQQASSVCMIIGAGASRAAGIPMAGELVTTICKDYGHCLHDLTETERKDYGKVMAKLSPADRESLITPLLENAGVSWGQIALATLAQKKLVSRILTFNFDLVLESAAALLGLQLPVYDFAAAPTSDINRIASRAIIHLHGQSHGLVLLNSDQETDRHKERLRPLLKETLRNHVTIVAGYSGEADGAFRVMEEEYNDHNHLLWLGYDKEPPAHLKKLLKNDYACYFGGCDFDLTMIEIAQNLGVWPPMIISNPMKHLLDELAEVKDFPVQKDNEIDVLTHTRDRLGDFAGHWERGNTADDNVFSDLVSGTGAPNSTPNITIPITDLSDAGREAQSWVYITQGTALAGEARTLTGKPAAEKFKAAGEKYQQAIRIKPDIHEAFFNWGIALAGEARTLTGKTAAEKFKAAGGKYQQAIKIKPDNYEAYNNWAIALLDKARTLTGKAKKNVYKKAEDVLRKAKVITNKSDYNLACLYAVTDRPDDALKELHGCITDGTLPDHAHLADDPDMASLQGLPEFIALLASIKAQG